MKRIKNILQKVMENPTKDKLEYAVSEFDRVRRFLQWLPIITILIIIIVPITLYGFLNESMPMAFYIIVAIFFVLKELVVIFFSEKILKGIVNPLVKLSIGFNELSDGNYGYIVEEDENVVGDLINSFNNMSTKIKESDDLKARYENNRKELIAGISHDLKTPITSVIGYVNAIKTGVANTPERYDKYLNIIEYNAKYTNTLINDLFMFSKLDINQMKYEFVELPIAEFLNDVIIEKQLEVEEGGVELEYSIDIPENLKIAIDGKMVYRIVSNIISNAIKYGNQENPKIKFEAKEVDDGVKIVVSDNGKGIPNEDVTKIFNVFYRGDAARNKEIGGSGLGLSIAKEIVEAHNGNIYAKSNIGEGTSIIFTLKKQNNF